MENQKNIDDFIPNDEFIDENFLKNNDFEEAEYIDDEIDDFDYTLDFENEYEEIIKEKDENKNTQDENNPEAKSLENQESSNRHRHNVEMKVFKRRFHCNGITSWLITVCIKNHSHHNIRHGVLVGEYVYGEHHHHHHHNRCEFRNEFFVEFGEIRRRHTECRTFLITNLSNFDFRLRLCFHYDRHRICRTIRLH